MCSDTISLPRSKSSLIIEFIAELLDVKRVLFVDIIELRNVPDEFVFPTGNSVGLRLCFIAQRCIWGTFVFKWLFDNEWFGLFLLADV